MIFAKGTIEATVRCVDSLIGMTSFTVYLSDPEVPAGLEFAGEAEFQFFENGVLQVADNDHVRYYAPGYWTQVHQGRPR